MAWLSRLMSTALQHTVACGGCPNTLLRRSCVAPGYLFFKFGAPSKDVRPDLNDLKSIILPGQSYGGHGTSWGTAGGVRGRALNPAHTRSAAAAPCANCEEAQRGSVIVGTTEAVPQASDAPDASTRPHRLEASPRHDRGSTRGSRRAGRRRKHSIDQTMDCSPTKRRR